VLDKALSGDPDSMPVELLRNKCIVIFRGVLISRSADLGTLQPYLFTSQNRFYVRFLDKVGRWRNHSVTGRALLFFSEYLKRVCSHPCFFAFRQTKNARDPLGPEYIAKVALKAMAEAGIDTADWKPTHYARQHQLIPWAELASYPPDLVSGSGDIASTSSFLPRASLQSFSSNSVGGEKSGSLVDGANRAGRGVRPKVLLPELTPEDERGGPRHSPLGTHNFWTPSFR